MGNSMNLSKNAAVKSAGAGLSPVLVVEGGLAFQASGYADPIVAWMELMEVVEALCPQWPTREPMIVRQGMMRL